ncbi:MAG: hypothetical protein Q4D62_12060 [Planctomycetia bacterium]|nr:hypothetical protein [Planctomycetia bacterium]
MKILKIAIAMALLAAFCPTLFGDVVIDAEKTITSAGDLSGTVTFNGGTLKTSTAGIVLNNSFRVNSTGGTMAVENGVSLHISGTFSPGNVTAGYGTLTKTGTGTLSVTSAFPATIPLHV